MHVNKATHLILSNSSYPNKALSKTLKTQFHVPRCKDR